MSNEAWFKEKTRSKLVECLFTKRGAVVVLPETMNFSDCYETTSATLEAIRRLTRTARMPRYAPRISRVDFSKVRKISTSAALVLTAELSRWESLHGRKLRSRLDEWDEDIKGQLSQLGFFDLFEEAKEPFDAKTPRNLLGRKLVRYIKARFDDPDASLALKDEVEKVIGDEVGKWTFMDTGLSEAITNVSHHAYPSNIKAREADKCWYLTGSYDPVTGKLKIVFYDQGIGIPDSLPATKVGEKALGLLARMGVPGGQRDATMIEAAMEISRTRTGDLDRGKGLNDLVEFSRKRESGYLSILSGRGLYRVTIDGAKSSSKTHGFQGRVCGTLIIWSTTVDPGAESDD